MGGADSKEPQKPQKPKAPTLQAASASLGARIEDLEQNIAKAEEEAKRWISQQGANPAAKQRAMRALKRKKMHEQHRDQLLGTQFNVEGLAFQQQQADITLTAVGAMQQAAAKLRQQSAAVGAEQVERLRDELQDMAADMQDVQAALAQPSAGADDKAEALFTFNRDVLGRGVLGLKEAWRVHRGRARDDEALYYCVCSAWGWEHHFYRSQADYDAGAEPVARLHQAAGTGVLCEETRIWQPAVFELEVNPGEDAALLLAMATALDVAHERSQPSATVI